MTEGLVCWRCGASLAALSLPLRREDACPDCGAQLHVCRLCTAYDPRIAEKCEEPDAEHPREAERANFCDYFKPRPKAYAGGREASERARDAFSALFGGGDDA